MKNKFLKRLLVLVMSGTLVVGTCLPSLAADTVTAAAEEESYDASADGTAVTSDDASAEAADAAADSSESAQNSAVSEDTADVSSDEDIDAADASEDASAEEEISVASVNGGDTISENGTYELATGSTGVITITASTVTIVGDTSETFEDLSLNCTTEGTTLTIENVWISSTASNNIIDFTGTGNTLYLAGTNLLDRESNTTYAVIHVGPDDGLTITDAPDDDATGILYMYKSDQAAGIGGDSGELNGTITFAGGRIFGKGSKQGAVIGTGSSASGTPGTISFTGGEYYLIANARGALIGGGAGSSGGTAGGVVNVSGGTLTLNVDFSGAAIGGGGYDAGNDASGGQLIVTGGSIRTYIDYNAVSSWSSYGVTAAGVNDAAITAEKVDGDGEAVDLYVLDTTQFAEADTYDVKVDGESYYSGGLHLYSYVNEEYDKSDQITIDDTTDNWEDCDDTNLYIYLTEKDHVITVNGESIGIAWDDTNSEFVSAPVTAATTGEGTIEVSDMFADKDDTVSVTATPDDGYYLAQVRYTYNDGTDDVTKVIEEADGTYSFTMPTNAVTITADFISVTWDGTIDVSWYDPDEDTYTITYAAQFAGAAALNNGLFNNYPSVTYEGGDYEIPYTTEEYLPYGSDDTYYNVYTQDEDSTVVVGDISYVKAYCSTGSYGSANPITSSSYWYGAEDFGGKTLLLAADLDMGGSYSGDWSDPDNWTGPNYMPLGGQYCMYTEDNYSILSSSFNGTLNGQGHIVYNIYCYRHSSNYSQGQSVGLIGRLGCHDSDSSDLYESPVVENIAVAGMIYGNRSVGGIVGKSGQSNGSTIENCLNFATVQNSDTKGVGGITGAGWNKLTIKNCANFGYIACNYSSNAGGISGSCEAEVINCYNFGYVYSASTTRSCALGTNNGGSSWTNCYFLSGSATYTYGVYSYSSSDTFYEVESADTFKTSDFLDSLNDGSRDWVLDSSETITSSVVQSCLEGVSSYTSSLSSYNCSGFAIPRAFINDTSTLSSIVTTGSPVTEYTVFETLDLNDLQVWASYSDGSKEEITDYTVTVSTGSETFTAADVGSAVTVTISGSYNETEFSFTYELTIADTTLEGIEITTQPSNTVYALGESFDPTGMVVTATFANGVSAAVEDYTCEPSGALTADTSQVTVSYTYNGTTLTAAVDITMLADEAPAITDGVVQIENASDMMWFSNQVTLGNFYDAILLNDIDLSSVSYTPAGLYTSGSSVVTKYYTGTFDGNEKTVTLALDTSEAATRFNGLFGGLTAGGVIKDLTLSGTITAAGNYTGAAAGYATGGRIENVTSNVTVTSTANYTAGLVGYAGTSELVIINCVNDGVINSSGTYTGGFVGCGRYFEMINCTNNAAVTGSTYSAGLVGYIYSGSIISSANNGTITVSANYAGGVTSYAGSSGATILLGCTNNGDVVGSGTYVGGIAGRLQNASSEVTGCMNYGDISGTYYVGGIVAYCYAAFPISECGNEGDITATSSSTSYYAGGITAYLNTAKIDSCYNAGDITSGVQAGGLVGYASSSSGSVTNSYNTGNLTSTMSSGNVYLGGLIGRMTYTMTLQNNYSTGVLSYSTSTTKYIGALVGCMSSASSALTNTSNNYALEDTSTNLIGSYYTNTTDTYAQFVFSDTLKTYATVEDGAESSVLGSAYAEDTNTINSGYPVLAWQNTTASEVIALIDAIGTVTGDSLSAIEEAFEAYGVLSAEDKATVTNYDTLVEAYDTYLELCAEAEAIEDLISAIGTVTLESSDAITAARTAYDAASSIVQALVSNYETLTTAETQYANLVAADAIDALILAIGDVTLESSDAITTAREAYDAATEDVQALVAYYDTLTAAESTYDQLRAAETDALIEAIGEVTVDSGDAIDAARASYDALSEAQQALVENYEVLTAAEQAYIEARAQEVDDLVEAIESISFTSGSALALIQAKYDALTDAQKALVNSMTQYAKYAATYANLMASLEKTYTISKQVLLDGSDVILETYETEEDGLTYTYIWYQIEDGATTQVGTDSSLNLGAELAVGTYSYTCNVTVNDGAADYPAGTYIYTLSIVTQEYIATIDAAEKTVALIDAIGEVTLESGDAIDTARASYDLLSDDGKALVTNLDTLTAAESAYAALVEEQAAADAAAEAAAQAAEVIALIDAIGDVTLESSDAITAARTAYDALSEDAAAYVTNLDTLTAAESAYAALEAEAEEAADADAAASAKAELVMALIEAIGDVTLESGDAITAARTAYDALSEDAAAYVTNLETLTAAESTYAALVEEQAEADAAAATQEAADEVIALIDAIGEVTLESSDAISAASAAYAALSDEAKALVTNADTLTAAESAYVALVEEQEAAAAQATVTAAKLKTVKNTKAGVKLTWSASSDASGYKIYRKTGSGAYKLIATISSAAKTSYVDKTAKNGKTYTYKVTAFNDTATADSAAKKIVRLTQGKIKSVKSISSSKAQVTVKKNKKAGGYQIVYSTSKNFKSKKTVTVKSKKQVKTVLKKLKAGKKYYVKVRSYKKSGGKKYYSAWSKVKTVKIKK